MPGFVYGYRVALPAHFVYSYAGTGTEYTARRATCALKFCVRLPRSWVLKGRVRVRVPRHTYLRACVIVQDSGSRVALFHSSRTPPGQSGLTLVKISEMSIRVPPSQSNISNVSYTNILVAAPISHKSDTRVRVNFHHGGNISSD